MSPFYFSPRRTRDAQISTKKKKPMARNTRRTATPNSSSGSCVGVDLNRNYDFLWDFQNLFAPTSTVSCSANPCDHDVYHGPSAFSEPESQNAKWMHDSFPNIGYFIDLHSYCPHILYSW